MATLQYFRLKCKHCGKLFASLIKLSSKGEDLDQLLSGNKETCPHCKKKAKYVGRDYWLDKFA